MKFLLPVVTLFLVGCQTPGVTVYGDALVGADGRVTSPKLVAINADIIGDIEVPGRLSIKTAVDGNGQFAYTEIPVTAKDGTVQITRQPMVAQIKTASVWDAWFSGATKLVGSIGQWVATAIGIGALAPAVSAGAAAIPVAP